MDQNINKPKCKKATYRKLAFLIRVLVKAHNNRGKKLYFYYCGTCNGFHLTHKKEHYGELNLFIQNINDFAGKASMYTTHSAKKYRKQKAETNEVYQSLSMNFGDKPIRHKCRRQTMCSFN